MSLNVHVFGPDDPDAPSILAIHGLTGHGRRWETLASEYLPDVRVVAPDLLGHGHSTFVPPWSIDAHLAALTEVVDTHFTDGPDAIVGHSFGGMLSVHLAHRLTSTGRTRTPLVLLDPAQGLNPAWAAEVAADSLAHWDYDDADHARAAKRGEGWARVPDRLLDKEIDDHLIDLPNGRVGWRTSAPAAATAWSEMARPHRLPPPGTPTTVVIADRVDPAFVTRSFLDDAATHRPETEIVHADCEHMVPFLEPELTAKLIRAAIEQR